MRWTTTHTIAALSSAISLLAASLILGSLAWKDASMRELTVIEAEVERAVRAWRDQSTSGAWHMNMDALYPRGRRHMLEPSTALPDTARYDLGALRRLRAYARSCEGGTVEPDPGAVSLQKAWVWHRHVCSTTPLPDGFFEAHPLMHPTGRSYVALAQSLPWSGLTPSWLEAHLSLVHVSELHEVMGALPTTSKPHTLLAGLPDHALRGVSARAPLVLSPQVVLTLSPSKDQYLVHPRSRWDAHMSERSVRVDTAGRGCALRRHGLCWAMTQTEELPWELAAVSLVVLGLLGLLGTVVAVGKERRGVAKRERFVLHTLTHELRTPVTGLELSLEPLREDFDKMSEPAQDAFLRIGGEVGRLRRVLAATGRLLSLHEGREGLSPDVIEPGDFVREALSRWLEEERVTLEISTDAPFCTDPHWLGVCVQNLVSNALVHGVPPVRVCVRRQREQLVIEVHDQGSVESSLESLTRPFERGGSSRGLGLGLSVVQRAAARLRGRLELRGQPKTTFLLTLSPLHSRQENS